MWASNCINYVKKVHVTQGYLCPLPIHLKGPNMPRYLRVNKLQKLKVVGLVAIAAAAMITAPATMRADTINLGGLSSIVTFTNDTTLSDCGSVTNCQNVSFSGVQVANPITPSDAAILGAAVTISNDYVGWDGFSTTFNPNPGSLSINYGGNSMTGNVSWQSITATGSGGFAFNLGLSDITVGAGTTDPIMNAFVSNPGNGIITFQFVGLPNTVGDLLSQTGTLQTSLSGTVSTPEPSSLMLFGSGALGVLGLLRRKLL